jgi:hypothetical protein
MIRLDRPTKAPSQKAHSLLNLFNDMGTLVTNVANLDTGPTPVISDEHSEEEAEPVKFVRY